MNETARAIVSTGDALNLTTRGGLSASDERQQAKLEALLAGACNAWEYPLRSSGGALTIGRTGTGSPLEVLASPLRMRQFALTPDPPAAVIFLRDPERSSVPLARLQQIYGLTVAEARVAQRLRTGESVAELSDSLKISMATARTHVRRLLDKLGAKSLSDLTRRIAGLPPVR
jgi:DNA-binding CsgD family transcriptional regulator